MLGLIKINKINFFYIAIFLAFFVLLMPAFVQASAVQDAREGLNASAHTGFGTGAKDEAALKADLTKNQTIVDLPSAIGRIVGAALSFIGIIFFILMIYGGVLWMTARGNDQQVEKAKDLIVAAIVGLIIVFIAYAITAFIGKSLTYSTTQIGNGLN